MVSMQLLLALWKVGKMGKNIVIPLELFILGKERKLIMFMCELLSIRTKTILIGSVILKTVSIFSMLTLNAQPI